MLMLLLTLGCVLFRNIQRDLVRGYRSAFRGTLIRGSVIQKSVICGSEKFMICRSEDLQICGLVICGFVICCSVDQKAINNL